MRCSRESREAEVLLLQKWGQEVRAVLNAEANSTGLAYNRGSREERRRRRREEGRGEEKKGEERVGERSGREMKLMG